MTDHTLDLSGLLGARICHDLVSPVGAISNGMELLELAGDLGGPERDLIAESAASANARLQLFRLAFGRAGSGQMQSASGIRRILDGYTADSDLRIIWDEDQPVSRTVAKALLLIVLCLEAVIGRAGRIAVETSPEGWRVTALAARGRQFEPLLEMLCGSGNWPADLTPARVQFPLAHHLLQSEGYQAHLQFDGAQVSLKLVTAGNAKTTPERSRHLLQDT